MGGGEAVHQLVHYMTLFIMTTSISIALSPNHHSMVLSIIRW